MISAKQLLDKTEEFKCIVCPKKFRRMLKKTRGRSKPYGVRGVGCVTCGPKCAINKSARVKYYKEKNAK